MGYDTVAELLEICHRLLRLVEAQENALAQVGALADAEGADEIKARLRSLQGGTGPFENGGMEHESQ